MTKRVWILGAGFSRPLGGPLLGDLMSMRRWRDLKAKYAWLLDPDPGPADEPHQLFQSVVAVYLLYHWGRDFPEGSLFGQPPSRRGEKHFEDAEDFLVRLENMEEAQIRELIEAASRAVKHHGISVGESVDEVKERVSRRHYNAYLEWQSLRSDTTPRDNLLKAARLLLALECEEFTKPDWRDREEFTPYKDWADNLNPHRDVIITFNYDRVVEEALGDRCCVPTSNGTQDGKVPVFKMHGSTDWVLEGKSIKAGTALDLEGQSPPFIAIPGRSKATDTKHLAELWERAHYEISRANEINVVGYGMPESDAKARRFLLQALAENDKEHLDITIVLGARTFRADRLEETLRQTLPREKREVATTPGMRSYDLYVVPQYAQDFIQGWALKEMRVNRSRG